MSNKQILQSNNDVLSTNNLNLQNLIELANNLPEVEQPSSSNPINCDSEWTSCANLPTTLAVAPPGSSTYYLEIPEEVKCVLFRNASSVVASDGIYFCATKTATGMSFSGSYAVLSPAGASVNFDSSNKILSVTADNEFLQAEYIFIYNAYE